MQVLNTWTVENSYLLKRKKKVVQDGQIVLSYRLVIAVALTAPFLTTPDAGYTHLPYNPVTKKTNAQQ